MVVVLLSIVSTREDRDPWSILGNPAQIIRHNINIGFEVFHERYIL